MTEQPLFYIVLLGLIVIVFGQLAYKKEKPQLPQSKALEEFEQTVELFASDLEEQNEALANLFNETKRDYELHVAKQTGKIESLEKQAQEMANEMMQLKRTLDESAAAVERRTVSEVQGAAAGDKLQKGSSSALMDAQPSATIVAVKALESDAEQPQGGESAEAALPSLKERYSQLFEMHDNGKSIEYIAKKLGKNKGEVSLILMLSRQEEAAK